MDSSSRPLRPDLDGWDGIQLITGAAERRITALAALDAPRLVPALAFGAVAYCVHQGADWIPYASIVSIALTSTLVQAGRPHAEIEEECTHVEAEPRSPPDSS